MGRTFLRRIAGEIPLEPVELWGLTFPNMLGVAAGYDKDARVPGGLALLGFGHIEVGTLTPWPQEGNERPRIFRLPADRAIINRMGFPNGGMVGATQRLRKLAAGKRDFVLGVSLGKQKQTQLTEAFTDYATVMRSVYQYADYLAVNISSPNTPGLRRLQSRDFVSDLLGQLAAENRNLGFVHRLPRRPLLVKVAPDLSFSELDHILQSVVDRGIDGVVATNTTTQRDNLRDKHQAEVGGLSGAPLAEASNGIIRHISRQTGGKLPIIGVGGVFTSHDVFAKLEAGATLVQVYTGLVYEGPAMAGRILRELPSVRTTAVPASVTLEA
jgi:dihydroorotate dehydrogenase